MLGALSGMEGAVGPVPPGRALLLQTAKIGGGLLACGAVKSTRPVARVRVARRGVPTRLDYVDGRIRVGPFGGPNYTRGRLARCVAGKWRLRPESTGLGPVGRAGAG
jgi:hypothetical protein